MKRGAIGQRGFTLVELMVVISIILILISIAVPIYQQTVLRSREAVLKQDLQTMRELIQQYTLDKQRAPQSLQDLVSAGYLREIPMDPITRSRETWVEVQEDTLLSVDQTEPGIVDVHSGSELVSSEGTPYSEW
ncbi:MAG TPA: prepilin-type N-terminal cleavage/methylation domain-containing protein [Terriglobales bacterium]|nr:prepilin-type N-terminal cleavage/methylation domain-containing protein [Terriglobales bacterium]